MHPDKMSHRKKTLGAGHDSMVEHVLGLKKVQSS